MCRLCFSKDGPLVAQNPLLDCWPKNYGLPPYNKIKHYHYKSAFMSAFSHHLDELRDIVQNMIPPTFENTIAKYDRCGYFFKRIYYMFKIQCHASSSSDLKRVELELSPAITDHVNEVFCYPGMYERIEMFYLNHENIEALNDVQLRCTEKIYQDFVKAGVKLNRELKTRYKQLMARVAYLETKFAHNLSLCESSYMIRLSKEDVSDLPFALVSALRQSSIDKNMQDESTYILTLHSSLIIPFLSFSRNRLLRQKVWKMSMMARTGGGGGVELGKRDRLEGEAICTSIATGSVDLYGNTTEVIKELEDLKLEKKKIEQMMVMSVHNTTSSHGADVDVSLINDITLISTSLQDIDVATMIEEEWGIHMRRTCTTEQVERMAGYIAHDEETWGECNGNGGNEGRIQEQGEGSRPGALLTLKPWDWLYCSERYSCSTTACDQREAQLYFGLSRMTDAFFHHASNTYNVTFVHKPNAVAYHPDVMVYEVHAVNHVGKDYIRAILLHDKFARSNKTRRAFWTSYYRLQTRNMSDHYKEDARINLQSDDDDSDCDEDDAAVEDKSGNGRKKPIKYFTGFIYDNTDTEICMDVGGDSANDLSRSVVPIVVSVNNFFKMSDGGETLLTTREVKTLFNGLGQALRLLLSNETYGTTSAKDADFGKDGGEVTFDLFADWMLMSDDVLKRFAVHGVTNEPISDEMISRTRLANDFHRNKISVENLALYFVDDSNMTESRNPIF